MSTYFRDNIGIANHIKKITPRVVKVDNSKELPIPGFDLGEK